MQLGSRYNQHSFAQVPQANVARSNFNRSHTVKDTMNFDQLTPIFVDEVLPGDTARVNVKSFIRLAPQVRPLLDNMRINYYFFFVPMRLLWDNFEKFMGAQTNPGDSTSFTVPQIILSTGTGATVGSIYDHMGIPTGIDNLSINALPFRAYNLIFNDWFRDQNLQNSLTVNTGNGPDADTTYVLKRGAKPHDYFTSCLPWPQKGTAVSIPIGTQAPVLINPSVTANYGRMLKIDGTQQNANTGISKNNTANDSSLYADNDSTLLKYDPNGTLYADLSTATAATINQFRQAIMMQSLLELDARGGTRYVEILRAHFNVISPDFRLQRPEYLGGGTSYIQQHPIAQTSSSVEDGSPQGNLAAFSTAAEAGNKIGFSKSFVEHGYIIGLAKPVGDVTYQQGLNRMWSRSTRWDFFWPKFQELGEQAVLNGEIYAQGTSADQGVFGYQERHADYRYKPSEIRGQFRSTYSQSLDVWHLAEEFSALPTLSDSFIQSATPIDRNLVVPDAEYPDLLCDYYFDYMHARPMVAKPTPATLGRF